MKPWIPFIYWCFVLLLVATTSITFLLISTETGTHWILKQALERSPVAIELSTLKGSLLRGLKTDNLNLKLSRQHIQIIHLDVKANWKALLNRQLHLTRLNANQLIITPTQSANKSTSSRPFTSPIILKFDQFNLGELIIGDPKHPKATFDNILLTGQISNDQLQFEALNFKYQSLKIRSKGQATLNSNLPLQADINLSSPIKQFQAQGTLAGTLNHYRADTKASIVDANFQRIHGNLQGTGNLSGFILTSADLQGLGGKIKASGDVLGFKQYGGF